MWAAIIHQERKNRGTDEGLQGEKKDVLQTHIHVMVSTRDADPKITLDPLDRADRFNRVQFQAEAVTQMVVQFGRVTASDVSRSQLSRPQLVAQKAEEIPSIAVASRKEKKPHAPEQVAAKDARLDAQVVRLNTKLDASLHLDPARKTDIARERDYDNESTPRRGKSNATQKKIFHARFVLAPGSWAVRTGVLHDEAESSLVAMFRHALPVHAAVSEVSLGLHAL